MKRVSLVLVALSMVQYCFAYDFSAVCSTGQTLYYNITSDSTVCLTKPSSSWYQPYSGYNEPTGSLVIPSNVFYGDICYRVSAIGENTFRGCASINKVVISDNITSIGQFAFCNCTGIDSLWLGCGLTTIGQQAFVGCSNLKFMYYNAGKYNTGLFNYSNSYPPFYNTNTPNFTTLIIGDSVQSIPSYAFYGRSSLNKLVISDNVTSIGASAFYNCSSIDSLWLGSGLTSIGSYAFYGCTNIHNLIIPDAVTNIGEGAFSSCTSIDSIYIGKNVRTIGISAFYGCTALKFMHFNAEYCGNSLFYGPSPFGQTNTSQFRTLIIGNYVRSVPNNAFYGRNSIDSLSIGNDVRSIGAYAFYGCSNITTPNTYW